MIYDRAPQNNRSENKSMAKGGRRAPFRVYRQTKVARHSSILQTPQFPFPICHKQVDHPLVNRARPVTALSKVRRRRKKTRKGRATEEGGRREQWCNSVELKELKDASLFVSSDSLPRPLYVEEGGTREKKKDVGKFAPFLLRSGFSRAASPPPPSSPFPLATSAPLQGANVCINRP